MPWEGPIPGRLRLSVSVGKTRFYGGTGANEESPDGKIPHFQFLTDADWLNAVEEENTLDIAADYRKAEGNLRYLAKSKFVPTATAALNKYLAANDNVLLDDPSQLEQLEPYFDPPVDDPVSLATKCCARASSKTCPRPPNR